MSKNNKNKLINKTKKTTVNPVANIIAENIEALKFAEHKAHNLISSNIIEAMDNVPAIPFIENISKNTIEVVKNSADTINQSAKSSINYFKYVAPDDWLRNNIKLFEANYNTSNKLMMDIFNQTINIYKSNISMLSHLLSK